MSDLYGRNITAGTILVSSWKTYSTISTNVSVIEVQNISDDSLLNAYKFIYNQVPYYYVVDGSHNYWVSDLSSIGYKLYEEPSYEFILVDDSTGRVTHGVESLNQIEFSPTGYFLIESDNSVIFVVELPTVSITGDFDTNNWLYTNTGGTNVSVLAGNSVLVGMGGSVSPIPVDYDTTKTYSVIRWGTYQSAQGSGHTEYSIINSNDKIYAKNVTPGDLYLYAIRIAVCSSNQASIVTVYDSSNTAYNAFKYTIDNIDYYYVLDEIQAAWTNDLSSIGYSLTPPVVLPTVTLANAYVYNAIESSTMTIYAGNSFIAKDASGNNITYNSSLLYKAYASYSGISDPIWFNNGWTPVESSGLLSIMNNASSGSRTVHHVCYATCSDSTATVVPVYDTSNVAYNAFKYTVNNTDYYYVLDGTQTDWTDDLAGIGYHFIISYLNVNKSRMTVGVGESYPLYNASGAQIEYDSTKTYAAVKYYTGSGDLVGTSALGITIGYISGWGYLMLTNNTGSAIQIHRIEYTIS